MVFSGARKSLNAPVVREAHHTAESESELRFFPTTAPLIAEENIWTYALEVLSHAIFVADTLWMIPSASFVKENATCAVPLGVV